MENLLRFSFGNAKLPETTAIFDLPAGGTCPGARECLSRFNRQTRKIQDGKHTRFRCSAAMQETRPNVAARRDYNFQLLMQYHSGDLEGLILASIDNSFMRKTTHMRWHNAGDVFSHRYAKAIVNTAEVTPEITHYLYTKSLNLFVDLALPSNLFLTASWGGRYDHLIEEGHFPRNSRVVFTEGEAAERGLPIDHDDTHAYTGKPHAFCHLVHGSQPKGSLAQKAINLRQKQGGFTGYGKAWKMARLGKSK